MDRYTHTCTCMCTCSQREAGDCISYFSFESTGSWHSWLNTRPSSSSPVRGSVAFGELLSCVLIASSEKWEYQLQLLHGAVGCCSLVNTRETLGEMCSCLIQRRMRSSVTWDYFGEQWSFLKSSRPP